MRKLISSKSPYEVGISCAVRSTPSLAFPARRAAWAGWPPVGEFFREIRPVNTIMQVSRFIDPEWLVEIEADAVVDAGGDAI